MSQNGLFHKEVVTPLLRTSLSMENSRGQGSKSSWKSRRYIKIREKQNISRGFMKKEIPGRGDHDKFDWKSSQLQKNYIFRLIQFRSGKSKFTL